MVLHLVGFASGLGGVDPRGEEGPSFMKQSPLLAALKEQDIHYQWDDIVEPFPNAASLRQDEKISAICSVLAKQVAAYVRETKRFSVIGGDHTAAMGVWSGVQDALREKGDIGLIWIDAHMDSHTPETTLSGRLHGMPLAALLGYGYPSLTHILNDYPKLKPENITLIGVRSFEEGEAALLKRLNVRVYFMDEVKERGFNVILHEALDRIKKNTVAYGMSIDLDGLDPDVVPGVDLPVSNGIDTDDFCEGLAFIAHDPKFVGADIVEFNPAQDQDRKTEKLIVRLISILAQVN